jgi:hypothetical protein
MQCIKNSVILAALLAGAAIAGQPHAAFAAIQDGNWSVLIVTEKGTCDRGYRYNVRVANGQVSYQSAAAINLAGTVAPDGAIKVSIKVGEKGANGTGRLSDNSGTGTWHGVGSSGTCAGHWEAERRSSLLEAK